MAVQGIWSGTVSFSLVAIPVRLVKAVEPGRVSFRMLHRSDYSPLARRMYCPEEGAVVPPQETIRGFEIGPERYVLVTDEELESLAPERSRTIEIIEFIDLEDVDPVYYDHPYYLVPSRGGEKAYRLLVEVLRRTKKAGLAKFVLAEREYLVAVTNRDGALALLTLHYSSDIRPDGDIAAKHEKAGAEVEGRIRSSIEEMTGDFDPARYADGRRKRIRELLEKKAKEQTPVEAPAIATGEEEGPPDLVAALEESMRKMKEAR
jgi:DNA end-binding protein Ku